MWASGRKDGVRLGAGDALPIVAAAVAGEGVGDPSREP